MNKNETSNADCLQRPCSADDGICKNCDYWESSWHSLTAGLGWCALFNKTTEPEHGRKCTGWIPRNPPNADIRRGGD